MNTTETIKTIAYGIKQIRIFLFWRGYFFVTEGSGSIEELTYLAELAQKNRAKLIGEIGFNAGFSSYAFLITNPDVRVISFDIGEHWYTKTAKKFIDKKFPGRHRLIYGDSTKTVPIFKKENPDLLFDLIFIDGGHQYEVVKADIKNMKQFARADTAVIIDDLTPWLPWGKGPTKAWLEAIDNNLISQKEMFKDGRPIDTIQPLGKRSWALGFYKFSPDRDASI